MIPPRPHLHPSPLKCESLIHLFPGPYFPFPRIRNSSSPLFLFLVYLLVLATLPLATRILRSLPYEGLTSLTRSFSQPVQKEANFSMAWRSSGATNAALIENLAANGLIKSGRVKEAMLAVSYLSYLYSAHFPAPIFEP